jgi:hypothetical protein
MTGVTYRMGIHTTTGARFTKRFVDTEGPVVTYLLSFLSEWDT